MMVGMMMRLRTRGLEVVLLGLLLAWAPVVRVVSAGKCSLQGGAEGPSSPSSPLLFCTMFPEKACCLPAQDAEVEGYFLDMTQVTAACAKNTHRAKLMLRQIYCFGCDPDQSKYVNESTADGVPRLRVCSDLAKLIDPKDFDDCGLNLPGERGNLCAGDDIVVPGNHYDADTVLERSFNFLNDSTGAKPPFFEDYDVEIVECSDSGIVSSGQFKGEKCSDVCYQGGGVSLFARFAGGPVAVLVAVLLVLFSTMVADPR